MARLKRNDPLPLYIQLKEALREDIFSRRLHPHCQLPSERELCERHGVSRMTVRQALQDLTRDGLIYRRVGKGTFVGQPKIDQQLKTLTGFSQEMQSRGCHPASRVLEARLVAANETIAAALHVSSGTEVVLLSRLRLADGVPLAIETVHLPHHYCPNLLQYDFGVASLYDILEHAYGYRLTRAEQTLEAAFAGPRETALLGLVPPAPILIMKRTTYTEQGVLIEYASSVYRGDRYKFYSVLAPRAILETAA